MQNLTPQQIRLLCRRGELQAPTPGLAPEYTQANLVILPQALAFDFLLFCDRNPQPCPVLDVTNVNDSEPRRIAPDSDIKTDLPKYRIYKHGELVEEVSDINNYWRTDFVGFLIGCSFSFEAALIKANIPVRHIEEGKNVPMYKTNIPCQSAGVFSTNLVVSMRPLTVQETIQAIQITSKFPKAHGAPVYFGNPVDIGIKDIHQPDFGDAVTIRTGEIPVFWACGVTTQTALENAKPEIAITHAPGHMFISDLRD